MKNLLLLLFVLFELSSFAQVSVRGYYRKNGTYVRPHQRTRPNHTVTDNYSFKGNVNPYTGEVGTKTNNNSHSQKSVKVQANNPAKYETYTHPVTGKVRLIEYVEDYTIEKSYEGTMTPKYLGTKQYYIPVKTPYPVKVNKMARFYLTYDKQLRGESYVPFLNSETMVEVIGRDKDRLYLVKYIDREGFLKEDDVDSIVVRKIDYKKLKKENEFVNRFGIIDTTNFAYGIVSAELSVFRDGAETNSENIIYKLREGTIIKVIAYHSNDFWVVKHNDRFGFMIDAFFRLLSDKEVNNYLQHGKLGVQKKRKKGLFGRRNRSTNNTDDIVD